MALQIIPRVRVFERGTGTDIYFGEQVVEQYTRDGGCFSGDREISCADVTERRCVQQTSILNCNPGCVRIALFRCECCRDEPTGRKTCTCERAVAPPVEALPPVAGGAGPIGGGGGIGGFLPPIMGAAGTSVAPTTGRSPIASLLLLAGVIAVGYYLYQRFKK